MSLPTAILVLYGYAILMTMANDRQPMVSYTHLTTTISLGFLHNDNERASMMFWAFLVATWPS